MFPVLIKWLSVVLSIGTAFLFAEKAVPDYYQFGQYDAFAWASVLVLLAVTQMTLLFNVTHSSSRGRLWSDTLLQITGLVYIILAGVFGATYPPFSWAMWALPTIGIGYVVLGRYFLKWSRECACGRVNPIVTDK